MSGLASVWYLAAHKPPSWPPNGYYRHPFALEKVQFKDGRDLLVHGQLKGIIAPKKHSNMQDNIQEITKR